MNENEIIADVIIIGGGPAGLSAALWCCELGMKTILFEKETEFGGQLLSIYNPIKNYIGVETGNGRELRDLFLKSDENRDFLRRLEADVAEINVTNKTAVLRSGEIFTYKALIVATGVRRRKLGVYGEEELQGRGIIDSGSKYREKAAGKTVVIVGGGDAAIENALILSEYAAKVYVVHRRNSFRARDEFLQQARQHPRIELLTNAEPGKFTGAQTLESVEIKDLQTGEVKMLPADIALIRIGVEPNTEMLRSQLDLDPNGYIMINAHCETNIMGIYAIGDAANPKSPTISTAAGTAAVAAKSAFNWTTQNKPV